MARPRSFPRRPEGSRRKTVWVGTADQGAIGIANNASVILAFFAPDVLSILKATVVRTRGIFQVTPTSLAADLAYGGAYGLGIVSDEAFASGAGAVPRPFDDDDWAGWLVHGFYSGRYEFHDATATVFTPPQITIDSKAMRKVGPNETLVWVVESQLGAVDVTIHARVLLMLS